MSGTMELETRMSPEHSPPDISLHVCGVSLAIDQFPLEIWQETARNRFWASLSVVLLREESLV